MCSPKFLKLPSPQQHSLAAHLLRRIFNGENLRVRYQRMARAMSLPALDEGNEALSNRFHFHAKEAGLSFKEHSLLIKTGDRPSDEPFLPIDIYLEDLRSAHNVGSILRTTEALRLGTVHFSEKTPYIDNKKVKDSAMGAIVPSVKASELEALRPPLIALETAEGASDHYDFNFPDSFSLLIGNEEFGLSKKALASSDMVLRIPLWGAKNSLNVAAAFAILASEIRRSSRDRSRK